MTSVQRRSGIESTTGPFKTLGEQLLAVRNAEMGNGSRPDPRLREINERALAGGTEMVPSDGGFTVQPEFSQQIVERMYETGDIFSRCLQVPIKTNGFKFPQFDESSRVTGSRFGGIQTYSINERGVPIPTNLQNSGYTATSTTSMTVVTGTQTFTTQANLAYVQGVRVAIASTVSPNSFMHGSVVSYSGTSMVVGVDLVSGNGTYSSWSLTPLDITAALTQKPSFFLSEVVPSKVAGLLYLTSELSSDTNAFNTWASHSFSQELMFTLENYILNGSGSGQPLGIMSSPALVSIAKAAGQQSGTVVSQNINSMLGAFWAKSYNSPGSIWLYNQALLPQLSTLATIVGTAGSESKLFQWCSSSDDYDRLAGFPALPSEYCAVPGTPGDLVLCDLSRYILVIRELLRGDVSIHVQFLSYQDAFRFVMRVGGQPIDRTAVVPMNGNVATSPFVALQSR
jgi:hypothetical protein